MPHADSSLVPADITTKALFWEHVHTQLDLLIDGETNWVSNLANASSLVYHSLLAFPKYFGKEDKAVNWCGFYLDASMFPIPRGETPPQANNKLLLGPFCGKPACQFINVAPGKARGVCAGAFTQQQTLVVSNVDEYPGHIACDGETKSEIVCPLVLTQEDGSKLALGVLDLDCLALGGFNEEDQKGLEKIVDLLLKSCRW